SKTKMQIETADSGDACIQLFKKKHYDLIFLDHMMPNKDGIETMKEMKTLQDTPNTDTPVICLTANAISGMREMYIEAGFHDYLTKPIDTSRLEDMILRYLPSDLIEHRILVVHEDVAFLKKIKEWLPDCYNVIVVKSEEQAVTFLQKQEVDLILMDDGIQLQKEWEESKVIRKHFSEIRQDEILTLVRDFFNEDS
ncbi:MAG: response regulator, partial [Lachnospiraceae bacterium]|nr:response regulator [Lachnospiraceae bacterium]